MTTRRRTRAAASDGVVRLEGPLQIREAGELVARLRAAVGAGTLRLDAAAVTHVDTAGLQALVAAVASARRAGASPEWLAASRPLADAARRLGLVALLALPAAG